jgi:hypothetical protein
MRRVVASLLALTLLVSTAPRRSAAEDPPPAGPAAEEPAPAPETVVEATAEELPALIDAVEGAGKKKKASEALQLLAKIAGKKHPEIQKALQKLLKHVDPAVALRAAELLELRVYPDTGKALWAASWGQAANAKRPVVRAKVLRALAASGFTPDKRQGDEIEDLWRQIVSAPNRAQAPLLVDIATFIGATKSKRFARQLAEMLDEPVSTAPNSPTNPPASYWEELWNLWNESKAAVHAALKALTGVELDSTEKAKAWIEEHARDGFDW